MTATEPAAARLSAQLTRLHALALALSTATSVEAVADAIVACALPALDAVGGIVATLDAGGEALTLLRVEGFPPGRLPAGTVVALGRRSVLVDAVQTRAPVWLETRAERRRRYPHLDALDQRTGVETGVLAALPLLVEGRATGALGLAFAAEHTPTASDRDFMAIVAQQCGQALERARLFDAAQREIAARIAVEQQMEQGRQQVLTLLSGIGDAFFALDRDFRYTFVNAAAAAMQGKSAEELMGRSLWEISPRAEGTRFADAVRRVMAEGQFLRTEHRSAIDGLWYESLLYPMPAGVLVFGRDISAQKAVEEHLRLLADAMPQIVWEAGPSGVVDYVNRRWRDFAGELADEHDPAKAIRQLTHPDDAARVLPLWEHALATGEPFEAQYRLLERRSGTYRWFLDRAVCTRDAHGAIERWFGTLTDIDAEKQRQETVARQARLLDLTYDAIFVRDLDSRITSWYTGAQALYGYRAAEAEGAVSHALLQTQFPTLALPIDALVRRDGIWEGELTHRRRDGSRVIVDSRQLLIFDEAGAPLAILETNRDATRRKQAEAERSAFVSSITHDLKNPLATIKGQAQLLARRVARDELPDPERLRAGLSAIDATATRMTAMLSELLDVSQLQTGQTLDLALAPTDLVQLVQAVARELQAGTERHTLDVQSAEPELTGVWDAARLERVIGNVLSNALKYSPAGGTITVRLSADEPSGGWPMAVLTVADAGIGIPAADLPHVFDWFFRARNVSGRFAGSGMGLPGAKRIVEQHGGSMSVASREGQGTAFTIRLPLA